MFALEETLTWTADDVLERLRSVLPAGWTAERTYESGWYRVTIMDPAGIHQWTGEHPDPKFIGLDALGWLRLRNHQVKNPAWKARETEVPFYRDSAVVSAAVPDPPDLDPSEVEAVYSKPAR